MNAETTATTSQITITQQETAALDESLGVMHAFFDDGMKDVDHSPEIMRIDPSKGYTQDNSMIVIKAYADARGELTEDQFNALAGKVLLTAGYIVIAPGIITREAAKTWLDVYDFPNDDEAQARQEPEASVSA